MDGGRPITYTNYAEFEKIKQQLREDFIALDTAFQVYVVSAQRRAKEHVVKYLFSHLTAIMRVCATKKELSREIEGLFASIRNDGREDFGVDDEGAWEEMLTVKELESCYREVMEYERLEAEEDRKLKKSKAKK